MSTVLIIYFVYVALVAGFGFSAVYHAKRFGFPGDKTIPATGLYLIVAIGIVIATVLAFGGVTAAGGS